MKIPKIIHQVWVGEKSAPIKWTKTWPEKHPDWEYILWDNKRVFNRKWKNQRHINFYKKKKTWWGIADIIRYEILYEYGGIMPGADSICLQRVDEIFDNDYELFTPVSDLGVFNDPPDPTFKSGGTSPLYASTKGNEFVRKMIYELREEKELGDPWLTTGNRFTRKMILKYKPRIKLLPAYYFVPTYKDGTRYKGNGKIYAEHQWGATKQCYDKGR